MSVRSHHPMDRLLAIMRALRDPVAGCPWDAEQTFSSIAPYTLEEAYETVDAIARGRVDDLRDELGDLLLQVVFLARIAEDQGAFNFSDVVAAICDKMVRRHPHVFGAVTASDPVARDWHWEADKSRARAAQGHRSAMDGVALALPALVRAVKLAKRAAGVGFDWSEAEPVWAKMHEELGEFREAVATGDPVRMEDEMGDVLFVAANLARHYGVDPEAALRRTNDKFVRRFKAMEDRVAAEGCEMGRVSLSDLDRHWTAVKADEKKV